MWKERALLSLPLFLAVLCPHVLADQVSFKNGDRLTGSIVKSEGKSVVIETHIAGVLTVQWPDIQELRSDQRLHVGLADGKTVVGTVKSSEGKLEIVTESNGTMETSLESVVALRNDAAQVAYEKSHNRGLLTGWEGGVDTGFELTRGNSYTKNLRLAFRADRKTEHDKISSYAELIYSTDDLPTARPHTAANEKKGGARFDRDFTARFFVFANADFMSDELQNLNLRSVLGGGMGDHLIQKENTTLDLLGGVNFTHENYVEVKRNFAAGQFSEEFTRKLAKTTLLTQNLAFFPGLSGGGSSGVNYRTSFILGTVTRLNKWLGWQNNFSDTYVTNPPEGKKQNELVFTSGLNIAFFH